jgi:hypothetical protein
MTGLTLGTDGEPEMDDPILDLLFDIIHLLLDLLQPTPSNPASTVGVTVRGGQSMPTSITIDDTAGKASFAWTDDHGDTTAAPAGVTVVLASDNTAVATLAADPATADTYDITPVSLGTFNVTLTATDASGAAATYPDGPNAGQPVSAAPAAVSVVAGPAASLVLTTNP